MFCQFSAAQSPPPSVNIQGTWELLAQKAAGGPVLDVSKSKKGREIKLIVEGHFVWVVYGFKSRTPDSVGGGTYTLAGVSYVERLDFASPKLVSYVGHDQEFTVKLDGDRLIQTGVLSDGTALQEVWQKVR
jgi:hypothetical protein